MLNQLKKIFSPKIKHFIKKNIPSSRKEMLNSKKFYSQFINPGALCFDVGANLGNRTVLFSELGAKVIAVEPQLYCINYLKSFFSNDKNVVIVEVALGDAEGESEISICDETNVISTMSDKWRTTGRFSKSYNWNKKQKVKVTTLDNLIQKYGTPHFCKIDVEGYELNVLKGLSKKIPFISFEFTKELFSDSIKCLDVLSGISNFEANYSTGESMGFALPQWVSKDTLISHINNNPDPALWGDIYIKTV